MLSWYWKTLASYEVTLCPGVERGAGLERGLGWVELPGSRVDVAHALRVRTASCVPRGTAPVTREVESVTGVLLCLIAFVAQTTRGLCQVRAWLVAPIVVHV